MNYLDVSIVNKRLVSFYRGIRQVCSHTVVYIYVKLPLN